MPPRPASPGKRYIKDPYSADSLLDLLSPSKTEQQEDAPRPSSPGKRYIKDPYSAGSLTELLSPTKETAVPVRKGASSTARQLDDVFVDQEAPSTPSKPERKSVSQIGAERTYGSRIFAGGDDEVTEERALYKTDPKKFDHFEIGADNTDLEVKPARGQSRHQAQWDFGDSGTPKRPTNGPPAEVARTFGYGDGEEQAQTPPARLHVAMPRRDADVHFEMKDVEEEDEGRIISSYQNRGQGLYENRLFDYGEDTVPGEQNSNDQQPLSMVGHNVNRQKDFDSHWAMGDSPAQSKTDNENTRPLSEDHSKAVKMMEASWHSYDKTPEPVRTATALGNTRHNQPNWSYGNDE